MKNDATIVAVRADTVPPHLNQTGFYPGDAESINALFNKKVWAGPRGLLENDPTFRQIIPYVIITQGDKYVTYVRGGEGGEARLHGKMSIGLGGHIDAMDTVHSGPTGQEYFDFGETVLEAASREIMEEVSLMRSFDDFNLVGLLIDNENEVGKVHLGVVMIIDETGNDIQSNEDAITKVEYLTKEELLANADRLEGWTRIFLEAL